MRGGPLRVLFTTSLIALAAASPARAVDDATWDGLTEVKAKRLDRLFLLKGADFRAYTKVLIAAPEVSFRKDWAQDVNRGVREPGRRITKSDVERIQRALAEGFGEILAADLRRAGWQLADAPGPDVLRLTPVLLNVDVAAPQKTTAGRSDALTVQAGEATVALEVADAETGMLLGRAVDRERTANFGGRLTVTHGVTNRAEFEALLKGWTEIFVEGLAALKEASPLGAAGPRE